jgi:primosomal protein N' (replication factor Y)
MSDRSDDPIAQVIPLTTTRAVRGRFDYRMPAGETAAIGQVLRVPFSGREILAVVAEVATVSAVPEDRLATATAVLPVSLPADLVALADWLAAEYCSTPARALATLLPAGVLHRPARRVQHAALTAAGAAALADPRARLSAGQRSALQALRDGPRPVSELGGDRARRLAARGLVELTASELARRGARHDVGTAPADPPPLTGAQERALAVIEASLRHRVHERLLLHGVTGSGKTEVYLRAVAATLAAGRGAIVLVPEIGLTPQAVQRFEARFPGQVAVLHSGLAEGARRDEWHRLRCGEARVAVGARSAVFAPVAEIGLIVVDEEHESSYKHEGDPRYDARGVAEERARRHGAVLLAGSATPRPETFATAARLRLAERVDGRPLPAVEVLDMRGRHHPLHPETRLALTDLRRRGGKAIVLLNRRGWSNFLTCGACARVWMCPNCEVALVLHAAQRAVACHHCGHREPVPRGCPECGSVSLSRHGAGTERLEHELRAALAPDERFPIIRLDADAPGLAARGAALAAFAAAPAGVLVGTQMIAKGHDFPGVALGVVVDADATLCFPDFRAEERTFALVTQLAGRAGRGKTAGGERPASLCRPGPRRRGRSCWRRPMIPRRSSPASSSAGRRSGIRPTRP